MERRNIDLETALGQAKRRFTDANPLSLAAYDRACASMPGGNTRTVLHYDPYPLTMGGGEGARLWDLDGHRYRDFLGEYSAGLYGHSNTRIRASIERALSEGIVLCAPSAYEAELAAALCARFPSCERVRFCNSGTEANLMAINAARAFTGREKILVFDGAYHGGVFYFVHGASPINAPYPVVLGQYNDLERTLPLVEQHADSLAAIVVEPMMGAAGAIPGDPGFLEGLRSAASVHGIVLIFDEVMTSRLSGGGLQSQFDVRPDMTSFGKYLGGGLSFGAFGGREDIMRQFDPRHAGALPHAGTFNNNVLTMAAGLTGLNQIYTPEVARSHDRHGEQLRARLNELARRRGLPVQITGIGSIMCVHFQERPVRAPEDTRAANPDARTLFHLDMLSRGFYLAQRGFMSLSLALSEQDCSRFADAFDDVLSVNAAVLA